MQPPQQALRVLIVAAGSMWTKLGNRIQVPRNSPDDRTIVALAWDGAETALIELDDRSTLNAMTQDLMQSLADTLLIVQTVRHARSLVL